jgi:hypothetical protein
MVGLPTRRMDDSCRWDNSGISEKSIFFDFIPLTFFTARAPRADDARRFFIVFTPYRIRYEQHSAQAAFG